MPLCTNVLSSNRYQNQPEAVLQDIELCFPTLIYHNIASPENCHYSEIS